MDDLMQEFLTETSENITVLDGELVALEQNPNDPGLISSIFRLVHTIKGTCGFLGLPRLEHVAHAAENVLGKFRDKELTVTPPAVTLILEALDAIKYILASLEQSGTEPAGDDQELILRLNEAAQGRFADPAATSAPVSQPVSEPSADAPAGKKSRKKALATVQEAETLDELLAVLTAAQESETVVAATETPPVIVAPTGIPATGPAVAGQAAAAPSVTPAHDVLQDHGGVREPGAGQSIRVNVDLLENLMTTVSELVLTRNQLLQLLRREEESCFAAPLQRLNQVVSELQEGVMKTRMQPIGNAWAKLPRLIRDLSNELSKKIELDMRGSETELDRQVLELIKDPLTHMVRNSADHGVERPADRLAAGKPEIGRIFLNAFHQGGHIIIQIGDDGRGLNIERIKEKAVANGLTTEAELSVMSETQIQQFIFRAGFSTAEAVTSVSGRGVGMDVVKTNIEKIGGTVELRSVAGQGSTFSIKIPLTLAIISALIVEVAGERYAIPQISVIELVQASADNKTGHRIEHIDNAAVLRLRDQLLPLVTLQEVLKLGSSTVSPQDDKYIIVTQIEGHVFGIIVDRVFDTEEIVVKPVSPVVRNVSIFSGNTILGDGSVIMILDPKGISGAAGELTMRCADAIAAPKTRVRQGDLTTALLIFRAGPGGPKAVPLSLIARLEEFERGKMERTGQSHVIQYRGKLMPLIAFEGYSPDLSHGMQQVLVFADELHTMGLMVEEILDITETHVEKELEGLRADLIGSAIVSGRATELIDPAYYLRQAFPGWFSSTEREATQLTRGKRILAVDDSSFFRNLLAPMLGVAGYDVTSVSSATEGLKLCEGGEAFDVIISDIEMPGMSGHQFARTLKHDPRWASTPMLALSSRFAQADIDLGRASGFNDYIKKGDREALLGALSRSLGQQIGSIEGHA